MPTEEVRNGEDTDSHGTAMATLIAGDGAGGQGIKGLAPEAGILPVKVGNGRTSPSLIVAAIRYAANSKAQIISISMGIRDFSMGEQDKRKLQDAVDYALKRGKLIFASAGNRGDKDNSMSYPAATPGVVGIASVDADYKTSKYSTHGANVKLAAPGENVPTVCSKGTGYCRGGGTSQATAIASASAALVWSMHPKWTNNQVLRVLMDTAGKPTDGPVPSQYIGYGTIRPRIPVLEKKGKPGPAGVNPLTEGAKAPDGKAATAKPTPVLRRAEEGPRQEGQGEQPPLDPRRRSRHRDPRGRPRRPPHPPPQQGKGGEEGSAPWRAPVPAAQPGPHAPRRTVNTRRPLPHAPHGAPAGADVRTPEGALLRPRPGLRLRLDLDVELAIPHTQYEGVPLTGRVPQHRVGVLGVPHRHGPARQIGDLDPLFRRAVRSAEPLDTGDVHGVQSFRLFLGGHLGKVLSARMTNRRRQATGPRERPYVAWEKKPIRFSPDAMKPSIPPISLVVEGGAGLPSSGATSRRSHPVTELRKPASACLESYALPC
ncbi:hypothetical protein GCM10020221_22050 [Streptomyces thioluteus]|uniref:Peptidase S8/S53 domain-containing protein n=1 Tax=Streptomyces thioluteus TaxID=66431 RepID=A0ABP6JBU7_STRTU